MTYLSKSTAFIIVASTLLTACRDRVIFEYDTTRIEAQQRYFPLAIGHSVEYRCDSIVYDFGAGGAIVRDSVTIFALETITDTLRDNSGELVYKIERQERPDDTQPWEPRRIWTASINDRQAIRTEENLRFLRLIFPIDKRSEWDGNLWIEADREIEVAGERMRPFVDWTYEVDSIDVPQRVGTFDFDSVLVITEVDETNIIERRLSRVRYATGVGLVSKEQLILDSQYCNQNPVPADCETKPWVDKAERGYILRQVVVRY
jgi:hypothetical protein